MAKASPKPMHFEEADEDGSVIPGATKNYARSIAPDDSPSKERPNTGRSRRDSKRRDSSPTFDHSDSDSTAHPSARKGNKMKKSKEDRKGSSSKSKTLVVKDREPSSKRPSIKSHKTTPAVPPSRGSDESLYYGITSQKTIASSRPRSHTRPLSYHAGSRPPLSGSAYYGQPPPGPQGYPPPHFPPPPAWGPGMPPPLPPLAIPPMHHPPSQLPPPPSPDFIRSNRELSSRFDRFDQRPQSASVYHQSPLGYEPEPPAPSAAPRERTVGRRSSVSRKANKDVEDRARMPPPSRPKSTAPERRVLRPPPPTPRKSVNFDDEFDGESDVFVQSIPRRGSVEYGSSILQGGGRRGSFSDESFDDDYERYQRESTASNRRSASYNYEDKINSASRYQNDVNGGPGAPLTAETLKRVKNDGSRGSTRSSESRDESDWKHSATTRTTRSASVDPDDITIKLPEGAVVEVNGARITCPGGGDVSLGRNNNGTSRAGSDRGTSVYGDDRKSRFDDDRKSRFDDERRSRHDRLPIRARASSQVTNPYSRSLSYAPPYPIPYPHNPAPYAPSFYDGDDYYYDT